MPDLWHTTGSLDIGDVDAESDVDEAGVLLVAERARRADPRPAAASADGSTDILTPSAGIPTSTSAPPGSTSSSPSASAAGAPVVTNT